MKAPRIVAAVLVGSLGSGLAHAQAPVNPYSYTCGAYIAAQQGQERGPANAVLYWAIGYLQGRLPPLPTNQYTAETFGKGLQEVHVALIRFCPNIPNMVIAEFMNNLAGDVEKSATAQQ
ncbi:hypothetical protein [Mesorhizobium sp. CAU 1741]|uniref:hypothetical protein n=1 Tax=Mesorhizobium sp. CAU 1741 TaxID=3140366 RepID=UPI00325BC9BE